MQDNDLKSKLAERNAVVVHFSNFANIRHDVVFPSDLKNAIENKDSWHLSCCVVFPQHGMNLPGDIGVIFCPTVSSVLSVSDRDSGSMVANDGSDLSMGRPLTCESFEETFNPTGHYNEWRLKGAEVIGIYVAKQNNLHAKQRVIVPGGPEPIEAISAESVDLKDVFNNFPDLLVYAHEAGQLVTLPRPS